MPAMGGRTGVEPVATNKVSKDKVSPLSSVTLLAAAFTCAARPLTALMLRSCKCVGLLRK